MRLFGKKKKNAEKEPVISKGLVLFANVEEAIKAEKIIKKNDYTCRLVAPPPFLRKGCDLALEVNLIEQPALVRILGDLPHLGIHALEAATELLQIVKVTKFPGYTMVKAGNMKLTFDNLTGVIVNTSGGGCPDIPYLHNQLVGKNLTEASRPRDLGFTLCALMLDRAFGEALALWKGGGLLAVNSGNNSR